ncbi:sensor domain-containing diguanylate cyclase [Acidicapsa acidisoli]|uniref:sensor domain-containing diguanylate cyclase n=1 Tax=Acidicapsa acidisoli TaxID=1615681 RepID=UPI0021E0B7DD|nr:diguanylate cyclase [Acidicapsa acidisoli]
MGTGVTLDYVAQNFPQNPHSLEVVLSAMPVGVSWANLADQKIVFMNRKFTEIFGYTLSDFEDISDWNRRVYPFPEDQDLITETWVKRLTAKKPTEVAIEPLEVCIRCLDGSHKTVILSGVILPDAGWVLATFVDITDRKRDELLLRAAERQAAESQAIYRLLLDHSPEMIVLSPFDESPRYVSPAVEQVTGFSAQKYLSLERFEMIHPADREAAERIFEELKRGNLRHVFRYRTLLKGGGYCWVESIVTGYIDPVSRRTAGYVATIRDISEEKRREDRSASEHLRLSEAASLDELTGIANRRAFNRAMESEVRRQARAADDLSLLMLDVDHFKLYNDLYGHLSGDACLKDVAAALKCALRREGDLAARFGGEEFVVLLPSTKSSGAEAVARIILKAVSALAIPHAESPYGVVTVSIGVTTWPSGVPLNQSLLIEQADRALYAAKARGRNTYVLESSDVTPDRGE